MDTLGLNVACQCICSPQLCFSSEGDHVICVGCNRHRWWKDTGKMVCSQKQVDAEQTTAARYKERSVNEQLCVHGDVVVKTFLKFSLFIGTYTGMYGLFQSIHAFLCTFLLSLQWTQLQKHRKRLTKLLRAPHRGFKKRPSYRPKRLVKLRYVLLSSPFEHFHMRCVLKRQYQTCFCIARRR